MSLFDNLIIFCYIKYTSWGVFARRTLWDFFLRCGRLKLVAAVVPARRNALAFGGELAGGFLAAVLELADRHGLGPCVLWTWEFDPPLRH